MSDTYSTQFEEGRMVIAAASGEVLETTIVCNRLNALTRDLAAAREELERERKPWRFQLITAPVLRKQAPDDYPDLSETYELELVDIGHSERVYVLRNDYLDVRIDEAEKQLAAANATVEKCKAAGFIDEQGNVRKVLGTLPITADGAVVGHGSLIHCIVTHPRDIGTSMGAFQSSMNECDDFSAEPWDGSNWFADRTAAEAAREGKGGA